MKENGECDNLGLCDCLADFVEYPSMEEGYQLCWWPECVSQKTVTESKLWFDVRADRTYNGTRR